MGYNILLVDDSKTFRAVLKKTLRLTEIPLDTLYEAGNGKEALEHLASSNIDVVLTDINMPVMSGLELIERMRSTGLLESIPVVIISTEASEKRIQDLKDAGVRAYLRKPVTPEAIRTSLESILKERPDITEDQRAALVETVQNVLERFGLMFAEQITPDQSFGLSFDQCIAVEMGFEGPASGNITLICTKEMLPELASGILGIDVDEEDPENVDYLDITQELLNEICGNIVTNVINSLDPFDLGIPDHKSITESGYVELLASPNTVRFLVDDMYPMAIHLSFNLDNQKPQFGEN